MAKEKKFWVTWEKAGNRFDPTLADTLVDLALARDVERRAFKNHRLLDEFAIKSVLSDAFFKPSTLERHIKVEHNRNHGLRPRFYV